MPSASCFAYVARTSEALRPSSGPSTTSASRSSPRLRALLLLQAPPLTISIRGIVTGVLLDRLALGLATAITLVALAVYSAFWGVLGVLVTWSVLHLVIRVHNDRAEAQFCTWEDGGPRVLSPRVTNDAEG